MPHNDSPSSTPTPRRAEEGSAYLVCLMVLLVVSLVGFYLAVVTQTEREISSKERTVQRIFYSADAGIAVATAKSIRHSKYEATDYKVRQARELDIAGTFDSETVVRINDEVRVTPLIPVLVTACDGCEVNEGGQSFRRVNHAVRSEALRTGTATGETVSIPLARKTIVANVEAQPVQTPPSAITESEAYVGTFDLGPGH